MPLVNVMVNARAYTIACDNGEEKHLQELAAHVDTKVRGLLESVGQAGEPRLMLMAALLVADDYFEATSLLDKRAKEIAELERALGEKEGQMSEAEMRAALSLEDAARRVEDIAAKLGRA
jgi:cell division protein ZapA